jgi:pyridoxamine 5'-phosphate oxidase
VEDQGVAVTQRLHKRDLSRDPLEQFEAWFSQAKSKSQLPNPNAMMLCTVSPEGWPEGRPVLLKHHDADGFVFFTNLKSEKGLSLAAHPRAELVFHWDPLGRQIRIRGSVQQVSDAQADAYFASRPRESQLGAWASDQSEPVGSWEEMNEKFQNMELKYSGIKVPRPPHWSGFKIVANRIEFWQQDAFRFHDRFRYSLENGNWLLTRLYP